MPIPARLQRQPKAIPRPCRTKQVALLELALLVGFQMSPDLRSEGCNTRDDQREEPDPVNAHRQGTQPGICGSGFPPCLPRHGQAALEGLASGSNALRSP